MPDTHNLIAAIIKQLQYNLTVTQKAADEAHHAATHEESVAENQYDTLGLEASYLAEGQSRRVTELQEAIARVHQLPEKAFNEDSPITLGAQIILQESSGKRRHLFLAPAAGGMDLTLDGQHITVISPASPLGTELLEKYIGDEVHIGPQCCEISKIF